MRVRYRANERVHGLLIVNGRLRVVSRSQRPGGVLQWVGELPVAESCRPGNYRLAVQARDLAGNLSKRVPAAVVPLRYIRLEETRISAAPGERLGVGIDTDAPRVRLDPPARVERRRARRGEASDPPSAHRSGRARYVLVATAGGHSARRPARSCARR